MDLSFLNKYVICYINKYCLMLMNQQVDQVINISVLNNKLLN